MQIDIHPVSEERVDDYLRFFDHDAFTDNPDWSGCYCCFYHYDLPNDVWNSRGKARNRESATQLILEGTLRGYLAYVDGRVVGWCNANNREAYPRLMALPDYATFGEGCGSVRAIVCYVVAPDCRCKGVATALLERVIADAKRDGCSFVEASPFNGSSEGTHEYHGPLAMYLKAGFQIVKAMDGMDVVRLAL